MHSVCRNGGIGRHEGLKIPWPVMAVRVQVPLAAPFEIRFRILRMQSMQSVNEFFLCLAFYFYKTY